MSRAIFKNEVLEAEFNRKGYVTVPFLNENQIDYFKEQFFRTIEESEGSRKGKQVDYNSGKEITYDFTFIDNNPIYKQKVFDLITDKFQSIANTYLNNYRPIIANYIRKKENGGEVPMHQNWAFVDEVKYTSVSVWVPLVDSNEENGTLQMVDGSHKRFGQFRGPMIPWELRNLKKEIVAKHLTPMNVKAGTAVILDDSIVHYSNINSTSGLRLAIQLIMVPEEADSIHYHYDEKENPYTIIQYKTTLDFYSSFHPWLKPKNLQVLGKIPYDLKTFSYDDFLNGLNARRFDKQSIAPLFKEDSLNNAFEKDGFVKIPLLGAYEIEDLKQHYFDLHKDKPSGNGFHVSLDNTDERFIEHVFEKLFAVLEPKLKPILKDFKCFTASYVVKEPGANSWVPPHQDWTFVDESTYYSATVWVPLMDVNIKNGALGLIKGSHKIFNVARNSPSPESKSSLSQYLATLFPYIEIIDMLAGEALIFNNKTVHGSPPNLSDKARIGVGIGITQSEAELLHYYEIPDTKEVEVYQVEKDFFKKYSNRKLSELYKSGQKPKDLKIIWREQKKFMNISQREVINLISIHPEVRMNDNLLKLIPETMRFKAEPLNEKPATVSLDKESIPAEVVYVDNRSFFEKYTVKNIIAEIKYRLTK